MQRGAWPVRICEDADVTVRGASFVTRGTTRTKLPFRNAVDAWVVNAAAVRELPDATIDVAVECKTTAADVAQTVFRNKARASDIAFGYKVLCQDTKYRVFKPGKAGDVTDLSLPLAEIGGVVQVEPLFTLSSASAVVDGLQLRMGAIVGVSDTPLLLQIDRQLYGDRLPVRWRDFGKAGLPVDALVHVHILGDSAEVWLNDRFKAQLALLDATGRGPLGVAGDALRRMIFVMVWERVLLWALDHEDPSPAGEKLPATRIVATWRRRFSQGGFVLPEKGKVGADDLNVLSLRIQHCLGTGPAVARIEGLLDFKHT